MRDLISSKARFSATIRMSSGGRLRNGENLVRLLRRHPHSMNESLRRDFLSTMAESKGWDVYCGGGSSMQEGLIVKVRVYAGQLCNIRVL